MKMKRIFVILLISSADSVATPATTAAQTIIRSASRRKQSVAMLLSNFMATLSNPIYRLKQMFKVKTHSWRKDYSNKNLKVKVQMVRTMTINKHSIHTHQHLRGIVANRIITTLCRQMSRCRLVKSKTIKKWAKTPSSCTLKGTLRKTSMINSIC